MQKIGNKGFTIIELVVSVAILAILSAVTIPTYSSYIESSRKNVCLANREILLKEVYTENNAGNYASLSDCFTSVYAQYSAKKPCPDGGTYTWVSDTSTTGHVVCSFHAESSSGGSGGSGNSPATYPGTSAVIQTSTWPEASAFQQSWSNVTVSPSGIFQYTDGGYYVITKEVTMTKSQASSGPGGEVYGWYATQKITGRIVTYSSDKEQKSDLARGDICKVGNDYYVYMDGGTWAYGPTSPKVSSKSWYKLP